MSPAVPLNLFHFGISFFYINTNENVVRRFRFETQMRDKFIPVTRIEAVPLSNVGLEADHVGVKTVEAHLQTAGIGAYKNHMNGIYSKAEVSLILSYKKVLISALNEVASPPYVIMEDDLDFRVTVSEFKNMLQRAPSDWEVLQFHVLNKAARRQFCSLSEEYVGWFPEFYSTAITVVRDENVAHAILNTSLSGHCVLDYWLYVRFKTYTHTWNSFTTSTYQTTMNSMIPQQENNLFTNCRKPKMMMTRSHMSMVIVTTSIRKMLERWDYALPSFVLPVIITLKNDLHPFKGRAIVHRWIIQNRNAHFFFSKWIYYYRFVRSPHPVTKYYIFADDDVSFRGFPWTTFHHHLKHTDSHLYGIPRESEFANCVYNLRYYSSQTTRDYFVQSNGDYWRNLNESSGRWSNFVQKRPDDLKFIEQGVVVFQRDFLYWYMRNIHSLLQKMNAVPSDWVIDIMWCPALSEYTKGTRTCNMFPFPVWHYDHGSLTGYYSGNKAQAYMRSGKKILRWASSSPTYKRWMDKAMPDMKQLGRGNQ